MIFWSTDIKWDHSGAGIYIDLFYDQTLARHFLGLLKAHDVDNGGSYVGYDWCLFRYTLQAVIV